MLSMQDLCTVTISLICSPMSVHKEMPYVFHQALHTHFIKMKEISHWTLPTCFVTHTSVKQEEA